MQTQFALLAMYGKPTIPLSEVAQEYFGLTPKTAAEKARNCTFPVPTFRLRDSQKAPLFVKIEDLAAYIDEQYTKAANEWASVNQ